MNSFNCIFVFRCMILKSAFDMILDISSYRKGVIIRNVLFDYLFNTHRQHY